MSNHTYRPDIDGLRAVAVVLVVLFHAGFGFSGGFIGVDVFFVISGYLITGIVVREIDQNQFRFREFWSRRVRRIIPAATVMVLVTLCMGWLLLLPLDYEQLAESAIAQQLMVGNFYFWNNTGYFSSSADLMPLLHMWSLGVEEQFYLFYPILLVALKKFDREKIAIILSVFAVCSFLLAEFLIHSHTSASFYLLPGRAWELLAGGILYLVPAKQIAHPSTLQAMSFVSLLGILVPAIYFDSSTQFPGVMALPPVMGTVGLIYCQSHSTTWLGRFLSHKSVVFVGKISFSLYLWHWPILAFSRYCIAEELDLLTRLLAVFASFGFAVLSWTLVERPYRRPASPSQSVYIVKSLCRTIPLVVVFSGLVTINAGYPTRVPEKALRYHAARNSIQFLHCVSLEQAEQGRFPEFGDSTGNRKCLIWGDSHAMSLVPAIDRACSRLNVHGYQATYPATPPLIDFVSLWKNGLNHQTPDFSRAVCRFVIENEIDLVILAGVWSSYALEPQFESQLQETIKSLQQGGAHVAIVLDVAEQQHDIPLLLAKKTFWGGTDKPLGLTNVDHRIKNQVCDNVIWQCASKSATVLEPGQFLIDDRDRWQIEIDGIPTYRDKGHLSVEGALQLTPMFVRLIRETVGEDESNRHGE